MVMLGVDAGATDRCCVRVLFYYKVQQVPAHDLRLIDLTFWKAFLFLYLDRWWLLLIRDLSGFNLCFLNLGLGSSASCCHGNHAA